MKFSLAKQKMSLYCGLATLFLVLIGAACAHLKNKYVQVDGEVINANDLQCVVKVSGNAKKSLEENIRRVKGRFMERFEVPGSSRVISAAIYCEEKLIVQYETMSGPYAISNVIVMEVVDVEEY